MTLDREKSPWVLRGLRAAAWHIYGRWKLAANTAYRDYRSRRIAKPTIDGPRAIGQRRGKALLTYLVDPFLPDFDPSHIHLHSNRWKSRELANILSELGFDVDVTDWENYHPPSAFDYDVVFGHGVAYERACRRPAPKCRRIFLGAIAYMDQLIAEENRRIEFLRQRKGTVVKRRYFANYARDLGPARSDVLMLLGTDWVINTYEDFRHLPIYRWRNVVVDDVPVEVLDKDFAKARKNFLWMAGYAAVHRGLDVFAARPDLHLWVCGSIASERDFLSLYQRELSSLPNIHFEGWTDVSGPRFREIVGTCGYAVYPSGSDAMAGALVNQMATGLVPIYTTEAGTDCGGFGFEIASYTHDEVRQTLDWAATLAPESLREAARGVSEFACESYSKERFRADFRTALAQILGAPS